MGDLGLWRVFLLVFVVSMGWHIGRWIIEEIQGVVEVLTDR